MHISCKSLLIYLSDLHKAQCQSCLTSVFKEQGKTATTHLRHALQDQHLRLVAGNSSLHYQNEFKSYSIKYSLDKAVGFPKLDAPRYSIEWNPPPRYSSLLSSLYRAPGAPWPPHFLRPPPTEVRGKDLVLCENDQR